MSNTVKNILWLIWIMACLSYCTVAINGGSNYTLSELEEGCHAEAMAGINNGRWCRQLMSEYRKRDRR